MISFLLHRPIAVIMTFLAAIIFSVLALMELPVSLLPAIDVPHIVIRINYPNGSPEEIETNILRPIREHLSTLNNITAMESEATSESGKVDLFFEHGTSMNLAYIDTNEKIDRLTSSLPEDLERPRVVRLNTSDIPIAHIQLVPSAGLSMISLSKLSEKVIKKRLESIKGVSLIDMNGVKKPAITIEPYLDKLRALGIKLETILQTIKQHNMQLGALSVNDGQYRYFLKVSREVLQDLATIKSIPIESAEGKSYKLGELALLQNGQTKTFTYHLSDNKEGVVLTVHKQAQAQMNKLMPSVHAAVGQLKKDFPEIEFKITRDQSELLNAGIDNLTTSLLYGGIFAFAVLFVFMGNFRIPLVIGISLPTSVLLSFLVFYVSNISLNIISLSGLALGLGMLIDNAIIVLDNISRNIEEKQAVDSTSLFQSCVLGVNEVFAPLISSVMTTLAIFIPLIFLDGMIGALFYDQAIAVAATLGASLLVAFILLPMCYLLFFRSTFKTGRADKIDRLYKENNIYSWVLARYEEILRFVFRHKAPVFLITISTIPMGILAGYQLKITGLPELEKTEVLLDIDWNEPIPIQENKARVIKLTSNHENESVISESDIGNKQFLSGANESTISKAEIYFKFPDEKTRDEVVYALVTYVKDNYPKAAFKVSDAPNAFNQLFSTTKPYFEIRFKNNKANETLSPKYIIDALEGFDGDDFSTGKGYAFETNVEVKVNADKLALANISYGSLVNKLNELFASNTITEIRRFGEVMPIKLSIQQKSIEQKIRTTFISPDSPDEDGKFPSYPLVNFMTYDFIEGYKSIAADRSGVYHSVYCNEQEDYGPLIKSMSNKASSDDAYSVSFTGEYFSNRETLQQLYFILTVSLVLLFFILAAQFESFVQPLIVVLTLPIGIGGSLVFLWLFGQTINIMSGIGIIVMLGIMVNDAILKIDTMNRLASKEKMLNNDTLRNIIFHAGHMRLKPILMTSLTTILALVPVLFSSGLGADLQAPLILSIMGGLTIGTVTALFFIPLAYYYIRIFNLR